MGAKGFTDEYLKTRSATFGELTKNLLAQDAKSAYKQAAIIMLRNAFADLELCGGERELDTESNCSIPVVSFNEACECDNSEVCGLCFRKKGYEMIDNKLTLTGEMEVCDKCDEQFTYAGDYRNICFTCEHDYI